MTVGRRECGNFLVAALVVAVVVGVRGLEEAECTSAYNYLAGCLTFVSGPDVEPNPVCCGGVNYLSTHDPHCLCKVIEKLHRNPNVNFTKACVLAYQCGTTVGSTECMSLVVPAGFSLPPLLPLDRIPPQSGDDESVASSVRIVAPYLVLMLAFVFTTTLQMSIMMS